MEPSKTADRVENSTNLILYQVELSRLRVARNKNILISVERKICVGH